MIRWFVELVLLAACLSGCGAGAELRIDADSPALAGLPPDIVSEVLSNPAAQTKISEESDATKGSMAQGIVRNFIICRDIYSTYQEWINTGSKPTLRPFPEPNNPVEPSYSTWLKDRAYLEGIMDSGDPDGLRRYLTVEGSCGEWIPSTPNDPSGPTIKQAVEGLV